MKFSYQWLAELVPGLNTPPSQLERLITMRTAECEGIEQVASDWIIDIDNKSLTHRPDLWGHIGMAREVAAITGRSLHDPVKLDVLPAGESPVRVDIEDHALCPRYSALAPDNVHVEPAPTWMQWRLRNIGINSINNIVDVTNCVLAELPQPMHAFDADKLAGDTIFVRLARPGERLFALNDETYELTPEDLVIADASGPIALAGVIGGAPTAISNSTTRVVLESANFNPTRVRLTSARHKLRTDASMRFEKSLDPENTMRGLARGYQLLQKILPGIRNDGAVADNRGPIARPSPIELPLDFVTRKLGIKIPQARIWEILRALGFTVVESAPGILTVTVPSWRATKDISLKDDLVEEIGRMIGYDEITPAAPLVEARVPPANPMRLYLREVRSQLTAQGFTEVSNYSFLNESDAQRFSFDISTHVAVRNPIASELTHLRRSLLPGLFNNIVSNVRHYPAVRIFEIGSEIHPNPAGLPDEATHAAAVLYDSHANEQDFFEMKRVAECVFPSARLTAADARTYEHPARTAEIHWLGSIIGRLFELHPSLLRDQDIEGRAMFFDVDLNLAQKLDAARVAAYTPLRRYPTSGFDLSVVAESRTPADQIQSALSSLAGRDLASIEFIRQYDGPPLPPGKKSVSYHLEVGSLDRTLTAGEVSDIRNRIIEGMRARGFDLRV
jgi:phenylalanyl-tRNA synthetase beta chain